MRDIIVRSFLYIVIALTPISCGTRKSAVKILKNAEIVTVKEETKAVVVKASEIKEAVKESAKVENVDEDKQIVVVELYNEQGVIKSRVVSINTNKKSNNTSNVKESLKEAKNESYEKWKLMKIRSNEITTVYKTKTVSSDRNGLYYAGAVVAIIGLAFWFKPWVK